MEKITLEQKAKELKQSLSYLGGMVKEGKYWLTIRCNELNVKKRQLYELEQKRLQLDDIWNYSDVAVAMNEIAIHNLKEDINSTKEQLKKEEKDQRELIYEVKRVNREYSKLERRLAKNNLKHKIIDLQELRNNCCSILKQKYELDKKAEEVMVNYIKSYVKEKGVKEKNIYTLEPKNLSFFYNDCRICDISKIVYTERSNEQDPKSNIEIYGTSRYGYQYFTLDRYFRFKEIENVFNVLK